MALSDSHPTIITTQMQVVNHAFVEDFINKEFQRRFWWKGLLPLGLLNLALGIAASWWADWTVARHTNTFFDPPKANAEQIEVRDKLLNAAVNAVLEKKFKSLEALLKRAEDAGRDLDSAKAELKQSEKAVAHATGEMNAKIQEAGRRFSEIDTMHTSARNALAEAMTIEKKAKNIEDIISGRVQEIANAIAMRPGFTNLVAAEAEQHLGEMDKKLQTLDNRIVAVENKTKNISAGVHEGNTGPYLIVTGELVVQDNDPNGASVHINGERGSNGKPGKGRIQASSTPIPHPQSAIVPLVIDDGTGAK